MSSWTSFLCGILSPPFADFVDGKGQILCVVYKILAADVFKDWSHVGGKVAADGCIVISCNGSRTDGHHVTGYEPIPEAEEGIGDFVQGFPLRLFCDRFNLLNNTQFRKHMNIFCVSAK